MGINKVYGKFSTKEVNSMERSLEKSIVNLVSKENLSHDEGLDLIDDLYWADWKLLENNYQDIVEQIFDYLRRDNLSNQETSKILKLYNNPDGSHIEQFAEIIVDIYKGDKKRFLKALNMEKEEATNLVYIFRANDIKVDEDMELLDLIHSEELTGEEKDTAKDFLKMYENICNT